MGNQQSGARGGQSNDEQKEKKKYEPPVPTRIGKKRKGPIVANKLPGVTPNVKCRLRLLKMERIKDHLLMEEEFIK